MAFENWGLGSLTCMLFGFIRVCAVFALIYKVLLGKRCVLYGLNAFDVQIYVLLAWDGLSFNDWGVRCDAEVLYCLRCPRFDV